MAIRGGWAAKLLLLGAAAAIFSVGGVAAAQKEASACSGTLGWVAVYVYAEDARYEVYNGDEWIWTTGLIQQAPDWYCYVDTSYVRSQTVACGFWGCSWETRAYFGQAPATTYWRPTPGFACRSGTNRYRGQTELNYRVLDFMGTPPVPVLVPGPPVVHSSNNEWEFSCK